MAETKIEDIIMMLKDHPVEDVVKLLPEELKEAVFKDECEKHWVRARCCSADGDGVDLTCMTDLKERDIRKHIADSVNSEKDWDEDGFDWGTTSMKKVKKLSKDKFYGCIQFTDYHTEYTVQRLSSLMSQK